MMIMMMMMMNFFEIISEMSNTEYISYLLFFLPFNLPLFKFLLHVDQLMQLGGQRLICGSRLIQLLAQESVHMGHVRISEIQKFSRN